MIIVPTMSHTATITTGSIAVAKFLTVVSISLLKRMLIFSSSDGIFPVCSPIFITLLNSIGKYLLSFPLAMRTIHIKELSVSPEDTFPTM